MNAVARVARLQLLLLGALFRLPVRRREVGTPFAYRRGARTFFAIVAAGVAFEGGLTELILALILPHTGWPVIGVSVHVWALFWAAGTYAGLVIRPHLLTESELRLRDGVKAELVIPRSAILGARPARWSQLGPSGLVVEGKTATLAHGDATVLLRLDPAGGVEVKGVAVTALRITVDDPGGFLAAVGGRVPA